MKARQYGLLDLEVALSAARGFGEINCYLKDKQSGGIVKVLMQYKKGFVVITTLKDNTNPPPNFAA